MKKKIIGILVCALLISIAVFPSVSAGLFDRFYEDDGIINPGSNYQCYRRDEYNLNNTFFQWWYFALKDMENGRNFQIAYGLLNCTKDLTNEFTGTLFGMIEQNTETRFNKAERYPLNKLQIENDFDFTIDVDPNDEEVEFEIEVIDNDTYHIHGKMHYPENVAYVLGDLNGMPVSNDLYVDWDLMIYRIYGWYGQQDLPPSGLIQWNTFAHASEVEGNITVGNTTYKISRNENYRIYCDENWGSNYPSGQPYENPIDYPWGWYYVGLPNADTSQEISIIAGIGRYNNRDILGIVEGKFADIRLDNNTHIGMRQIAIWKLTPNHPGISYMDTSNDKDLVKFRIYRDQWTDYTDSLGTASIPLHQCVYLESKHYIVEMDFYSELEDYNRLPAVHENYIFSDFAGMGVRVHVVVKYHTVSYRWCDILNLFPKHHYTVLKDFWSDYGEIEYGYKADLEIN